MIASLASLFDHDEPPIERAALAIAQDEYPALDVPAELARLDALARPLERRLMGLTRPRDVAAEVGTYLYDEHGFHGNETAYDDPKNSYLNEVLARRTGLPITLAAVLMAVGRRAGVTVEGIGFPGHFLVRLGGEEGVYLDPFFHARVLEPPALQALFTRAMGAGAKLTRDQLAPVSIRAMTVRMLHNLKMSYERRRDAARAMVLCDRLADLTGSPEFMRDRAVHALTLGAFAAAENDLSRYLALRPAAADLDAVREMLAKARAGRAKGRMLS